MEVTTYTEQDIYQFGYDAGVFAKTLREPELGKLVSLITQQKQRQNALGIKAVWHDGFLAGACDYRIKEEAES